MTPTEEQVNNQINLINRTNKLSKRHLSTSNPNLNQNQNPNLISSDVIGSSSELNHSIQKRRQTHNFNPSEPSKMEQIRAISICIAFVSTIIVLTITSNVPQVLAFNIDTQSAVIHQGPQGSYFGFTVAQHKDRGVSWLLVGAPKAQTEQPKTKQSGAVYRCVPTSLKSCQQIPFDPNGSSVIKLRGEPNQADDKSYQWFGSSLQSANDNGSFVACAPRYVYFSPNLKRREPVGSCWVSRGSFGGFLEYSPCRLDDHWGHHKLGSCQAGFSSAITKDGSRIFIGAPGAHVWQGQVFSHDLKTDKTRSTSSVNPHSEDDSYIGYSIALGRFSSRSQASNSASDTDVAIGIPRALDLAGKVMLVDRDMKTLFNLTGEQVGSRFGDSLAVADINGDGLDDLIVGAPLYYNNTERYFDRGRIYVYLQNIRHELMLSQRIDGKHNGGRLGTSVASVGDLNRDGFVDIAVGAPYGGSEGRGAILIFMGRKSGLPEEPDQIIAAESIKNEANQLHAFGYSLSGGLDLDSNGYPDLLVGDYASDRAILLRTRPVVNITTSLSFQPENFNLDDKTCILNSADGSTIGVPCITVQHCISYNGFNVDNKLPFVFDIKLDTENKGAPRLFFLNQQEGKNEDRATSLVTKDVKQCRSFKAYITKQIRDKLTPIKIEVDYNLAESGDTYDYNTSLTRLRPVLNRAGANKLSKAVSIQKNCGQDNICVPDLKLTVNPNIEQYTIGSNEKLVLDVTVKNNGEDAFESMFYLTMPMTINFNNINKTRADYPICYGAKPDQTGINMLTCDLGNPLVRNDIVKFSIITEPARGVFTSPDFTFVAQVNSTNPELDDRHREDNQVFIGIPIRVEINLVLSGNSNPTLIIHNSTSSSGAIARQKLSEADLGPEVYHTYQLQNRGPSTINDIALTILWPTKSNDGDYLLYLVDEPLTNEKVRCKPSPDDTINPLGLRYLRGNSVVSQASNAPNSYTQQQYSPSTRYKRQTTSDTYYPTTISTVDTSILEQQSLLTCGPTQCNRFECNVINLGNNEIATIKIRSRLYEDTLNHLSLQDFDISSKLVAQVKSLPYNVSTLNLPAYVYKVETQVHTSGIAVQNLLQWWMVLPAIIVGILLLVILACCLKYWGFFDRKRPPKTAEKQPLTPTPWNDYQYNPGH